jgi:ribosomal protein S18 acetylase RimI-like enzyme
MSEPSIRAARHDDAEAIQAVARESWSDVYHGLFPESVQSQAMDTWYSPEALRLSITASQTMFLVAETPAGIVGFAELARPPNAPANLARIYVLPTHQQQGIGVSLFDDLLTRAKARGIAHITVAVAEANQRARTFYERLGFVSVGEQSVELFGFPLREVTYELVIEPEQARPILPPTPHSHTH